MKNNQRAMVIGVLAGMVACAGMGMWVRGALAAGTHPLVPPPKIIAGKFNPDPVMVGKATTAHLTGVATPPEKVDLESMAVLTWAWHVDKVQVKTADGAYTTPPASSYEVGVAGAGTTDGNVVLALKPKRAGEWKVTVHATATYTSASGNTYAGNTEGVDVVVKAVEE